MGVGLAATHVWTLAVVGLGAAHARLTLFGLLRHRSQGYRATARAPQGKFRLGATCNSQPYRPCHLCDGLNRHRRHLYIARSDQTQLSCTELAPLHALQ
jgi:hypothetical protein